MMSYPKQAQIPFCLPFGGGIDGLLALAADPRRGPSVGLALEPAVLWRRFPALLSAGLLRLDFLSGLLSDVLSFVLVLATLMLAFLRDLFFTPLLPDAMAATDSLLGVLGSAIPDGSDAKVDEGPESARCRGGGEYLLSTRGRPLTPIEVRRPEKVPLWLDRASNPPTGGIELASVE